MGLRQRVIAAFALGALVLSAGLAIMTYELAKKYLLDQRVRSVAGRSYAGAGIVENELLAPQPDIPRVLSALALPVGSQPVLLYEGRWFAASLEAGRDDIPRGLREEASGGTPGRQLFRLRGVPHLVVGVPLAQGDGAYFEVASLAELDRTLRTLRNALVAAGAVTTVAGAVVGIWAGRRLLRPLTEAAEAATAVGSGRLDVRLDTSGDADLDALTHAFNGMTSALQQRMDRDARFASAVSHELRSPLTTLATSAEVLHRRRDDLPERARNALDLLEADVRRFQRLVEDLLEMSRIGAGAAEVSLEPVRPEELVVHALRSAKASDVPVDVDPSASGAVVHVDKRRMERVIVNLVENAQSHGGGIVRMAIDGRDGKVIRLAVEDAGPGVAPEDRD
ncbi:MAG TPA: histidine kinase dimerization/phospho-acceptor domain-containing protein, partial [Acidimicrobiales bacterium]|nr:histidine kinase dimerization/phospho-acceptor domain-containing protein [Acidimicrobiales bacterium]